MSNALPENWEKTCKERDHMPLDYKISHKCYYDEVTWLAERNYDIVLVKVAEECKVEPQPSLVEDAINYKAELLSNMQVNEIKDVTNDIRQTEVYAIAKKVGVVVQTAINRKTNKLYVKRLS